MAIRRYTRTSLIFGSTQYATPRAVIYIRKAVKKGKVSVTPYITKEAERLDAIAGKKYGSGKLWWIIAAASDIGWALQVPPGTRLLIPNNLGQVAKIVG